MEKNLKPFNTIDESSESDRESVTMSVDQNSPIINRDEPQLDEEDERLSEGSNETIVIDIDDHLEDITSLSNENSSESCEMGSKNRVLEQIRAYQQSKEPIPPKIKPKLKIPMEAYDCVDEAYIKEILKESKGKAKGKVISIGVKKRRSRVDSESSDERNKDSLGLDLFRPDTIICHFPPPLFVQEFLSDRSRLPIPAPVHSTSFEGSRKDFPYLTQEQLCELFKAKLNPPESEDEYSSSSGFDEWEDQNELNNNECSTPCDNEVNNYMFEHHDKQTKPVANYCNANPEGRLSCRRGGIDHGKIKLHEEMEKIVNFAQELEVNDKFTMDNIKYVSNESSQDSASRVSDEYDFEEVMPDPESPVVGISSETGSEVPSFCTDMDSDEQSSPLDLRTQGTDDDEHFYAASESSSHSGYPTDYAGTSDDEGTVNERVVEDDPVLYHHIYQFLKRLVTDNPINENDSPQHIMRRLVLGQPVPGLPPLSATFLQREEEMPVLDHAVPLVQEKVQEVRNGVPVCDAPMIASSNSLIRSEVTNQSDVPSLMINQVVPSLSPSVQRNVHCSTTEKPLPQPLFDQKVPVPPLVQQKSSMVCTEKDEIESIKNELIKLRKMKFKKLGSTTGSQGQGRSHGSQESAGNSRSQGSAGNSGSRNSGENADSLGSAGCSGYRGSGGNSGSGDPPKNPNSGKYPNFKSAETDSATDSEETTTSDELQPDEAKRKAQKKEFQTLKKEKFKKVPAENSIMPISSSSSDESQSVDLFSSDEEGNRIVEPQEDRDLRVLLILDDARAQYEALKKASDTDSSKVDSPRIHSGRVHKRKVRRTRRSLKSTVTGTSRASWSTPGTSSATASRASSSRASSSRPGTSSATASTAGSSRASSSRPGTSSATASTAASSRASSSRPGTSSAIASTAGSSRASSARLGTSSATASTAGSSRASSSRASSSRPGTSSATASTAGSSRASSSRPGTSSATASTAGSSRTNESTAGLSRTNRSFSGSSRLSTSTVDSSRANEPIAGTSRADTSNLSLSGTNRSFPSRSKVDSSSVASSNVNRSFSESSSANLATGRRSNVNSTTAGSSGLNLSKSGMASSKRSLSGSSDSDRSACGISDAKRSSFEPTNVNSSTAILPEIHVPTADDNSSAPGPSDNNRSFSRISETDRSIYDPANYNLTAHPSEDNVLNVAQQGTNTLYYDSSSINDLNVGPSAAGFSGAYDIHSTESNVIFYAPARSSSPIPHQSSPRSATIGSAANMSYTEDGESYRSSSGANRADSMQSNVNAQTVNLLADCSLGVNRALTNTVDPESSDTSSFNRCIFAPVSANSFIADPPRAISPIPRSSTDNLAAINWVIEDTLGTHAQLSSPSSVNRSFSGSSNTSRSHYSPSASFSGMPITSRSFSGSPIINRSYHNPSGANRSFSNSPDPGAIFSMPSGTSSPITNISNANTSNFGLSDNLLPAGANRSFSGPISGNSSVSDRYNTSSPMVAPSSANSSFDDLSNVNSLTVGHDGYNWRFSGTPANTNSLNASLASSDQCNADSLTVGHDGYNCRFSGTPVSTNSLNASLASSDQCNSIYTGPPNSVVSSALGSGEFISDNSLVDLIDEYSLSIDQRGSDLLVADTSGINLSDDNVTNSISTSDDWLFAVPSSTNLPSAGPLSQNVQYSDQLSNYASHVDPSFAEHSFSGSTSVLSTYEDPLSANSSFCDQLNVNLSFNDSLSANSSYVDASSANSSFANMSNANLSFASISSANSSFVTTPSANSSLCSTRGGEFEFEASTSDSSSRSRSSSSRKRIISKVSTSSGNPKSFEPTIDKRPRNKDE